MWIWLVESRGWPVFQTALTERGNSSCREAANDIDTPGVSSELRHGHPDGGSIHESFEPEMPPDRTASGSLSTSVEARFLLRRRNGEMDVIAPNLYAGPG